MDSPPISVATRLLSCAPDSANVVAHNDPIVSSPCLPRRLLARDEQCESMRTLCAIKIPCWIRKLVDDEPSPGANRRVGLLRPPWRAGGNARPRCSSACVCSLSVRGWVLLFRALLHFDCPALSVVAVEVCFGTPVAEASSVAAATEFRPCRSGTTGS